MNQKPFRPPIPPFSPQSPRSNAALRWFALIAAGLFVFLVMAPNPAERSGVAFLLLVVFLPLLIIRHVRKSAESLFDRRRR